MQILTIYFSQNMRFGSRNNFGNHFLRSESNILEIKNKINYMGTYRAPGQVIDRSYEVANQQIAAGINKYDKLF